jgi:hypothetical protein
VGLRDRLRHLEREAEEELIVIRQAEARAKLLEA